MSTSLFEDLLKKKPKVPDAPYVDPGKVQLETVAGNEASFAAAKDLASQFNDFMATEMSKRLAQTFPELEGLETAGAGVIASRLRGELSTSDVAASQRSSAAKALGLGIGGSPAGSALSLRDLGIKQYQAQSEGLAQLPGFASTISGIKRAPMFDFSNTFLNPAQRWQMAYENATNKWNVDWLKNQVDAQPSGPLWAFAKQFDSDIEMAKQAAVSYFGGGIGGGGAPAGNGSAIGANYMEGI